MLDFVEITEETLRNGTLKIKPNFPLNYGTKDLMIRGRDFYAVWDEQNNRWSKSEQTIIDIVDGYLRTALEKYKDSPFPVKVEWMKYPDTGSIDRWHRYCQKQMRDTWHILDQKVIFANTLTTKEDYSSHRLPYPLEEGDVSSYEQCMSIWYDIPNRTKLEWSIGAIISGDIDKIEKFIVLYGPPGSGKSSFLKYILMPLFEGYWSTFDATKLASSSNRFWGDSFRDNPLVSIQTDGKLSRIEDNTRLNSIVSHETMEMEQKFKDSYPVRFRTMLYLGTNEPVKISDAKSGIIRRLIDVYPTGNKIPEVEYFDLVSRLKFELGAIAQHCLTVYSKLGPYYYNDYVAKEMLAETNDFYNFIEYNYEDLKEKDYIPATEAWRRWQEYKTFADIDYKFSYKKFCTELKNYFRTYKDEDRDEDGNHIRSVYKGFIFEKFKNKVRQEERIEQLSSNGIINRWLYFKKQKSLLDDFLKDYPAQYAVSSGEKPTGSWSYCTTKLSDLDTTKLHFVNGPVWLIMMDFDKKNEKGVKDLEENIKEANKWPATYAEVSKSGGGIHLYYIYNGDPLSLANRLNDYTEVKVFSGNQAIRRIVNLCNDIPVATISSGLKLKDDIEGGKKDVINFELYENEKALKSVLDSYINKWVSRQMHTSQIIKLIKKTVDEAYEKSFTYDISDYYRTFLDMARQSTNNADACEEIVQNLHYKSKDMTNAALLEQIVGIATVSTEEEGENVIFDIEVYPNLLLIAWKKEFQQECHVIYNPNSQFVEDFFSNLEIIGYNNRKYDNHVIYGRAQGDSLEKCYLRSKRIIGGDKNAFLSMAYSISKCDVYDMASAGHRQSLKKYEIELGRKERKFRSMVEARYSKEDIIKKLGIPETLYNTFMDRINIPPLSHVELEFDWNKPIDEDKWPIVARYCMNDVRATEDVFHYLEPDYKARKMLAVMSHLTVNDSTNAHTAAIIFGSDRNPQSKFIYTNLATIFPGYEYKNGVSTYRGEDPSEGGYVYSEPGIYFHVAVLDVASMHPSSIIALNLFGDIYTERFKNIVMTRLSVKHKDFDAVRKMMPELGPYLDDPSMAKPLADALKTAINSVYGLTSATFPNRFKDPRNVDNIVAKRGALFMIELKHFVQSLGYTVAHIKTDSIKIPNATPAVISEVIEFGKKYGYNFEHESTYERMALVNDSTYIAKYDSAKWCEDHHGYIPEKNVGMGDDGKWTATAAQFQHPFVFKKLFSGEDLEFDDICEIKSVSTALYLDCNEGYQDVSKYETINDLRRRQNSEIVELRDKFTKKERELLDESRDITDEQLNGMILAGHNRVFIGRVGEFVPVKPGSGGGILERKESDGLYSSANGAKGYRWLEADTVRDMNLSDYREIIDWSYFEELANKAKAAISKHGDFDAFVNSDVLSVDELINAIEIDGVKEDEVPFNNGYLLGKKF